LWSVAEHPRLGHPALKSDRYFRHERLAALLQTVQKLAVAAIQFVKRPDLHLHPVGQRAVDEVQRDLRLGAKLDLVGHIVFLRRAGSSAHSCGR